jgi:hypothetical protein
MSILRHFIILLLIVCLANSAMAQVPVSSPVIEEVFSENIDSLIADSILKQFILYHEPLSPKQLKKFNKGK